jgi:hypothetical protein
MPSPVMMQRMPLKPMGLVPPLPSPMLWLRSDMELYQSDGGAASVLDTDVVGKWGDISGNARHALEATNKPILKLNQINGLPSIRFDGTNDKLQAAFVLGAPFSLYLVVNQISWTSNDCLAAGQTGDNFSLLQSASSPNIRNWGGSGTSTENADLAVGVWGIVSNVFATGSGIRVNNGTQSTGLTASVADRGGLTLAAHPTPSSFGNIELAEVLLYSGAHTSGNETTVFNYLSARYGIS